MGQNQTLSIVLGKEKQSIHWGNGNVDASKHYNYNCHIIQQLHLSPYTHRN
jgi:hypothetical protein